MNNTVNVTIIKPLYGQYCGIRDTYIKEAISKGMKMKVTIPQGSAVVDPKWWRDTGKKKLQEFRIKGRPMVLYFNHVPIEISEENRSMDLGLTD